MNSQLIISITVFVVSMAISMLMFPVVRDISIKYKLYAFPNHRSSHQYKIPNIGGIVFYLAVFIALVFLYDKFKWGHITLLTIISFGLFLAVGLIDDIGNTRPWQKFIMQILGVCCFLLGYQIMVTNFLGFWELGISMSFIFTLFLFLLLINALNMMDGIDGLAGMLALSIYIIAGIILLINKDLIDGLFSISMAGILIGFLRFNYSKSKKILMGDTGSLWLGFTLSIILLKLYAGFNEGSLEIAMEWDSYFWVFSAMIVPVLDLFRVALFRIFNGYSPFHADRNHIHHILIDRMQFTHFTSSVIIVSLNILLFACTALVAHWLPAGYLILYFLLIFILFSLIIQLLTSPYFSTKLRLKPKS
ncbi:glycosyltransferase family 4 protein [Bacteroidota bacterium]